MYNIVKIKLLEIIPLIFIFALKIHFYIKMKRKNTTSNNFDLDKYYAEIQDMILNSIQEVLNLFSVGHRNANAGDIDNF